MVNQPKRTGVFMNGLTLKDVLHRLVHENEMTPRQQAEEIGVSYSMLTNAANPDLDDFKFAARHIIPLTKVTKDYRLLDFMEASCGRVAFSLPEIPDKIGDLQEMTAVTVKEFGDVLTAMSAALADGEIGYMEIKRIELEILEQVRASLGLLEAAKKVAA